MKKLLLWIVLLILWIGGSSYWYVCKVRKNCACCQEEMIDQSKRESSATTDDIHITGFKVNGPDGFELKSADNLHFLFGSHELFIPSEVNDKLGELTKFINNDPHNILIIDGLYTSDENGNAQLGLDRAKALQDHFVNELGGNAERFRVSYDEKNDLVFDEQRTKTYGAIELSFNKLILDDEEVGDEVLHELITSLQEPVNVYFETGSSIMHITPKIHQYVSNLHTVLVRKPELHVAVTGHTDNTGDLSANYSLSKKRAEEVIEYLVSKRNIPYKQVNTFGKGPDEPLGPNDSEEGQALNRRVEIRLNK